MSLGQAGFQMLILTFKVSGTNQKGGRMTYKMGRAISVISLAVALFAGMAKAQQADQIIRVKIPFEFTVGRQAFPAGEYSIAIDASRFVALRDARGRVLTTVLANRVESKGKPASTKLKFDGYGGQHVLAQVWRQDEDHGYELGKSRSRTSIASAPKETVAAGTQP